MTAAGGVPGPAPGPRPQAFRQGAGSAAPEPRLLRTLVALGVLLAVFAGFVGLGTWQVQRRAWKLDLIARVQHRIHAAPVPAPGPAAWSEISDASDAYRRVQATGVFMNDRETRVQAATELGGGFWVITPMRTRQGFIVLVNRGFVAPEQRDPATRRAGQIAGETTVTGLMRMTEPTGGFLRRNDPATDRWYSRDVAAIAAARDLTGAASYFIDADATPNAGGAPVGGLTVTTFPNSHLVYALTWYGLALMTAAAAVWTAREEWRTRRRARPS